MPLLLTPAQPLLTTAQLPVASIYAIIEQVNYARYTKVIQFEVGYYASEPACVAGAARLLINALPISFNQPASPEEANAVPIFQFLEQVLTAQLQQLVGEGAIIEAVA